MSDRLAVTVHVADMPVVVEAIEDARRAIADLRADLMGQRDAYGILLDRANELERENAALRERVADDNEVCLCGCSAEDHEYLGADGEACGHDDHPCVRVCTGVRNEYVALRERHAEAVEKALREGYMLAFMDHGGEWRRELLDAAWLASEAKARLT